MFNQLPGLTLTMGKFATVNKFGKKKIKKVFRGNLSTDSLEKVSDILQWMAEHLKSN